MASCCVLFLLCVGLGVCSTLGSYAVGSYGYFGMAMLNMATSCFSASVCFYTSCRIGMDGAGLWRAYARSAAACVTTSDEERIMDFFCIGNSSIVPDTRSDDVLGMYDVSHL